MFIRPVIYGLSASLGLLLLYAITMSLFNGIVAAIEQFRALWWLMLPLSSGFGIQVGLYAKLKQVVAVQSKTLLATSGTSAGIGMLACCAHHVTDVLPLIGLSGVSLLLSQYQLPILMASLVINLIGILLLLNHLHRLKSKNLQNQAIA